MRRHGLMAVAALLAGLAGVWAQPVTPALPSTTTTRDLLRSTNAADFRLRLGLVDTNVSVVAATGINVNHLTTNAGVLALKAGGVLPAMDGAALTNLSVASAGALTNYDTRLIGFSNVVVFGSNLYFAMPSAGATQYTGMIIREAAGVGLAIGSPDSGTTNGLIVVPGGVIVNDLYAASNIIAQGTIHGNGAGLSNVASGSSLVYNVEDYGANGADGSDDTAAIQAALDAAAAGYDTYTGRRVVYLPAGRYYITNTLWLKSHGITVRGDGMYATLIRMQVNTNAFGSWTNRALWYCNFEKFNVYKDVVLESVATPAAFYFVASDSTQIAHRFGFDEVACSGFYYGIYVRHAVGLYAQRCEFYGCNYAFYMEKSDATTFVNCHAGDAYDSQSAIGSATNRFGATHSAAWTYKNTPTASRGFSLVVIGGESRRVDNVFDLQSGVVNIVGTHCELVYDSLLKASGSGVSGGIVSGLSCVNLVESRTPHAAMRFLDGTGRRFSLGPCYWPYSRPLAQVEQAGDYVHYTGQPALMSNTVSTSSWYMPVATNKVVVAAGANVTVTPSQSGPITTYTVAASGTGGTDSNAVVEAGSGVDVTTNVSGSITRYTVAVAGSSPTRIYTTNYTVDLSQSGYLELVSTGEAFGLSFSGAGERSVTILSATNPVNYVRWPNAWWSGSGAPTGLAYDYAWRMRVQRVSTNDTPHITYETVACTPFGDEDAQAFLSRAEITDSTISNAVNALVTGLKATNIWAKADAIFPFVGGTSNSTRINLRRNDKHITWGSAVTFDANGVWGKKGLAAGVGRGEFAWDFTSTTNQFQTNACSVGWYIGVTHTNVSASENVVCMGAFSSGGRSVFGGWAQYGTNLNGQLCGWTTVGAAGASEFRGATVVSRTNSTSLFGVGRITASSTSSSTTGTPANTTQFGILGADDGEAQSYLCYPGQLRFVWVGGALSAPEATELKRLMEAFNTALGRAAP